MKRTFFIVAAGLLLWATGCAPHAAKLDSLEPGMTETQVATQLGKPEKIKRVRFMGHERDYTVWEYKMVPDVPT
ncbi:MAG: hypothetical protein PVG03_15045 [Desulfarculaceae bacterium]|jgi:hypothetical protein